MLVFESSVVLLLWLCADFWLVKEYEDRLYGLDAAVIRHNAHHNYRVM